MITSKQVLLRENSGIPVIEISGTMSNAIEGDLMAAYEQACQSQPQDIILKFVGNGRIYSSGVNVLIKLVLQAEKKGQRIHAAGLSRHFAHILSVTSLTKHIQVFPSEEEALDALR